MSADQAFVLLGIVLVAITGFFFFRGKKKKKQPEQKQPEKISGKTKHPGSKRKKKRK